MDKANDAGTLRYIAESVIGLVTEWADDQPLPESQVVTLQLWEQRVFQLDVPGAWYDLHLHVYLLLGALKYQGMVNAAIRGKTEQVSELLTKALFES